MRTKKGIVTSSKQDKTATVTVHAYKTHPKYKKRFRVSSKFYVHDPKNELKEGDLVLIGETKPLSKLKRWNIVENFGNQDKKEAAKLEKDELINEVEETVEEPTKA